MRVFALWLLLFLSFITSGTSYKYIYRDYGGIVRVMQQLASSYPDLVEVLTVEKEYGLNSTLTCGNSPCEHWYLRLFNRRIHGDRSELPEVFLSGELHGDERVGPNAVLAFAIFLLQNRAVCDPSYFVRSSGLRLPRVSPENFNRHFCRLMDTREIIIMPMSNAWGYFYSKRTENGVDVNRDFPFDYTSGPYHCLRSESSRALQELYYHHMFMAAVTFHGGMKSITYEWGDTFNRKLHSTAPDHLAMKSIAEKMNLYSGKTYQVGTSNDIVYAVRGGMEEWGYAGTWFNQKNSIATVPSICEMKYTVKMSDVSNRCVTFLVEATTIKSPPEHTLGDDKSLFDRKDVSPINTLLRQCLVVTEIIRPYATLPEVNNQIIRWSVGGCFHVDKTEIRVYRWREEYDALLDIGNDRDMNDEEMEKMEKLIETESALFVSPIQFSRVFPLASKLSSQNPVDDSNRVFFETTVPSFSSPCIVLSVSTVDSFFHHLSERRNPKVDPQSLLVLSRNSSWRGESIDGKHTLKGRGVVLSVPVKIEAGPTQEERGDLQQLSIEERSMSTEDTPMSFDINSPTTHVYLTYSNLEMDSVLYVCIHHFIVVFLFLICIWLFHFHVS